VQLIAADGPANCPSGVARLRRFSERRDFSAAIDALEPIAGELERIGGAIPFVRVHPNDVIAFRQSRNLKAKSDPIDARLIQAFVSDELSRRGGRRSVIGDERHSVPTAW
jgi:hypothetical protein